MTHIIFLILGKDMKFWGESRCRPQDQNRSKMLHFLGFDARFGKFGASFI